MALSVDLDWNIVTCCLCLDQLKIPVTTCGHSYCSQNLKRRESLAVRSAQRSILLKSTMLAHLTPTGRFGWVLRWQWRCGLWRLQWEETEGLQVQSHHTAFLLNYLQSKLSPSQDSYSVKIHHLQHFEDTREDFYNFRHAVLKVLLRTHTCAGQRHLATWIFQKHNSAAEDLLRFSCS